ncbi:MAG TPA: hypothetical protein VHE79_07165 [Spirochaetia bacterium]
MARLTRFITVFAALFAVFALGGCQAIFTYSPVAGLQRSPSSLTPEQRVTYAENALASGDTDAMKAAYEAIKDDTGDQAQYLAAQLGFEASGVPDLVLEAVTEFTTTGTSSLLSGDATGITDFFSSHPDVDPQLFIDAAANLANVSSSTTVDSMSYVYAGLGMALEAAQQPDGSFDFSSATPADLTAAANEVLLGQAGLSPSDPVYQLLDQFSSYLAGL